MLYVTLRQYEYLVAVARMGSLTAAARFLNISQPSLSVAITRIEKRLERELFVRGKGVPFRPTAHGRSVIARAEALLAQATRLEDPAGLGAPKEDRVSMGFFDDLAPRWLAATVAALGDGVPAVDFTPSVGGFAELARQLGRGQIDLALTYDLGLDASYERAVVARVSPYAFMPADDALGGKVGVTLKRLAERPLVLFDDGLSIQHMLRLFDTGGLRPRVVHRAASLEVMRSLAAHGIGIGISYTNPPSATSYDGRPLASVRVVDRVAVEPIVLAWPVERANPLPLSAIVAAVRRAA